MKRLWVVFTLLSLLVPILLTACGGDGSNTATPIQTATVAPTSPAGTTGPAVQEPVKLGVVCPWSGPMAMSGQLADQVIAVVEQQVSDMGGILGGRQVEFIKGDDRGNVAESVGQARRLVLEDNVDMLLMGGVSGASQNAVAREAENLKVPFVSFSTIYGSDLKYNASIYSGGATLGRAAGFVTEYVKPKTVAWLGLDDESVRNITNGFEDVMGCKRTLEECRNRSRI